MKTYRVYLTEEVEFSYDVVAKDESEAKEKVLGGDYGETTYNIIDSHNCQIDGVEEIQQDD
jgi:hypothetical protein